MTERRYERMKRMRYIVVHSCFVVAVNTSETWWGEEKRTESEGLGER